MLVPQQQFAAVAVVAVHDINPRLAEVRQAEQQPLLDLLELPRLDHVVPGLLLIGEREQLVLRAELRRQERVDEGDVVVDAADLEDLLPPQAELLVPGSLASPGRRSSSHSLPNLPLVPALLDVAKQLDAELVGVEPAAERGHGAGVVVGVVDDLRRLQDLLRS